MSGTVDFVLRGLDTQVNLITGAKYPEYTVSSTPASYYLDISLNSNALDNIFYFSTTNPDLNSLEDANDCAFYVDTSNWPVIAFSEGGIVDFNKTDINQ